MWIFCSDPLYAYISGMKEKKKSRLSESFVVGVIALVFLIVGYQTALFVYRASVMKIVSNRDEPDTVFIYPGGKTGEEDVTKYDDIRTKMLNDKHDRNGGMGSDMQGDAIRSYRKSSLHSRMAEEVRRSAPRKKVESFRFNPNMVTTDELCRLGFSQKQALSIVNYRAKGGKFRRKSDFAKSFVVSDSIYRRLEPYIDSPLIDLNLADSSDFDSLPGIGGWFAAKMVEHRKALGGYSYKEQLMDIYRFDKDKYKALEDLVTVSPEYVTPYPLWTLPADSLRLHPYIRNYETARSIVLYRENSDKSDLTPEGLHKAGIIDAETAVRLAGCKIRNP